MSMTRKEASEMKQLRRENVRLRTEFAGLTKTRVYFNSGDRINGPKFFLPEHAPVYMAGVQFLLEDDGRVRVHGDDSLTVFPQAANACYLFSLERFRK